MGSIRATLERKKRAPFFETPRVGGRSLRVAIWRADEAEPKARPLLFFNGIGANIELMAPLADWLFDRDIITFDMPGVGKSPAPVTPYRPWMMARYAMRLLDHYGFAEVDAMGVSWGGCMAQQMAFQHPRRVGKLVLAATSPGHLMVPGDMSAIAKIAHPRRYLDADYFRSNFAALYGGEIDGVDGHAERMVAPSLRGYFYQVAAMTGWTSLPFLPLLSQETLVLNGDEDRIVPLANGRILAGLIPNARLHIVKGGGHLFIVSRAAEVVPVIARFLDGNGAESQRKPSREVGRLRADVAESAIRPVRD